MAERAQFLTRPLQILTWAVLLLTAQWSVGVEGVVTRTETESTGVCGPSILPEVCVPAEDNPVENVDDVWQVDVDCTVPNTLGVSIKGESSRYELQELLEVRITCTDGSDQAEMLVNCSLESRDVVINNISASGIQPGWTCSVSGCFYIEYLQQSSQVITLARTQTKSCTFDQLLQAPTTTDLPTTTSTEVDDTPPTSSTSTGGDVTMTTGVLGDLSTTVPETDESSTGVYDLSTLNVTLIPILVSITGIVLLLMTVPLMILLLLWMKQQKARKTALLVLDPQNMIFDPDYTPSICIDNKARAHRISVISNMSNLHFLTAIENAGHFQTDIPFGETDSRFGYDLTTSESKQQNCATKDMAIYSEEYPGSNTSGYVFSGHSKGFNTPQQTDTYQDEFHSPSDSASELTLSCHSSDYTTQLGNPGLAQDDDSSGTDQEETLSGGSLSLCMPDPVKEEDGAIIGLDSHRCSHPSCSSAGYVEQFNTPNNKPLTRDADNVFELDLELEQKQHDGYQLQSQFPIPSNITHSNHQTEGYVMDFQNAHQLDQYANHQETEITACLNNYLECPVDMTASDIQSTHVELDSRHFQSDVPHLTNAEGYVLSDHPTALPLIVTQERESQEFSVALDCENLFDDGKKEPSHKQSSQASGLPSLSLNGGVHGRHCLDMPCDPDMNSNQGYINTEDIDMTKFTSRDIVVPSDQFPPSQIKPSFIVCLDIENGIASCQDQTEDQSGYVCNSGMESKCNVSMQLQPQCLDTSKQTIKSNGYVTSELEQPTPISGATYREQYISYDFRSMASELRDSYSDSTSITSYTVHSSDLGPKHAPFEPKSSYYPASDMSSGYLSGSSVSGDTSVYLGMDKLEQLDLYSYK